MGHRDYVADLPQPSDLQDLMMRLSFKAGLFVRLLAVCILVAFICGALVTVAFHSYRSTLTQNRLGAELTAQADALAPLAAETLAAGIWRRPNRSCSPIRVCNMSLVLI